MQGRWLTQLAIGGVLLGVLACGAPSSDAASQGSSGARASAGRDRSAVQDQGAVRVQDRAGAEEQGRNQGQAAGSGGRLWFNPVAGRMVRLTPLEVGGVPLVAEIADTPELRETGLMFRDSLPPDHGMLFVYPEEQSLSFWMRNTRIPLDIAFIDRNGVVVNIDQMAAQSDSTHASSRPAMYALEMRLGWFADHSVRAGARLEF